MGKENNDTEAFHPKEVINTAFNLPLALLGLRFLRSLFSPPSAGIWVKLTDRLAYYSRGNSYGGAARCTFEAALVQAVGGSSQQMKKRARCTSKTTCAVR